MYNSFSFRLVEQGTENQYIEFRPEGAETVKIPVPGMQFPNEAEPKFRMMYQVLIDQKLVMDKSPIYNP